VISSLLTTGQAPWLRISEYENPWHRQSQVLTPQSTARAVTVVLQAHDRSGKERFGDQPGGMTLRQKPQARRARATIRRLGRLVVGWPVSRPDSPGPLPYSRPWQNHRTLDLPADLPH